MKKSTTIIHGLARFGCFFAAVMLLGCGQQTNAAETADVDATAKELSRPLAMALLNREAKFATTDKIYNINGPAFARAQSDGVWEKGGGWWQPTTAGAKYFVAVSLAATTLRHPLHREVTKVTGITDGPQPGVKVAEFTWHFTDLTEPIAAYTGARTDEHAGQATFRRYDDGWRVVDVQPGNGQDGANARPFNADREFAAKRTASEMCSIAIAWQARYTDLTTYHLVPPTFPPSTDTRYRTGGVKTTADVKNALSPTYIKTFPEHDMFGREYRYEVSADGEHFTIASSGADGKFGSDDDLVIRDGQWAKRAKGGATACDK